MFKSFVVIGIMSMLVACREPELNFVFITNNTDQPLKFTARFISETDQKNELSFSLAQGEEESWRYTSSDQPANQLDNGFRALIIETSSCEVSINREALEKIALQDGAWRVSINSKMIACQSSE